MISGSSTGQPYSASAARGLVASSAPSTRLSFSSSNSSSARARESEGFEAVLAFARARSAKKTAPYPSAARSTQTIAEPSPAVIQTRPIANPATHPTYRIELSTIYLLGVKSFARRRFAAEARRPARRDKGLVAWTANALDDDADEAHDRSADAGLRDRGPDRAVRGHHGRRRRELSAPRRLRRDPELLPVLRVGVAAAGARLAPPALGLEDLRTRLHEGKRYSADSRPGHRAASRSPGCSWIIQ